MLHERKNGSSLAIIALLAAALAALGTALASPPVVGPSNGTLLIVGGGDKTAIWPVFFDLIGGKDTPFVVIPTANEETGANNPDIKELQALGASYVILHTTDPKEADTDKFVAPLKLARAVWITGGRQWRLVDSYLGTKTQKEIQGVLARGGVVGGSSAGASIMASFLVRGAKSGNDIMMAPGYETGFDLTHNTAIDQHIDTRSRADDIKEVLAAHPELLGIGLDEATGIIVRGDRADVIGANVVRFTFPSQEISGFHLDQLTASQSYDLAARRILAEQPTPIPVNSPAPPAPAAPLPVVHPQPQKVRAVQNGKLVRIKGTAQYGGGGIARVEYALALKGPYRRLSGTQHWRGTVKVAVHTRRVFIRAVDAQTRLSSVAVISVIH